MTERRLLECCCACPAGLQGIVNRLAVDEAEVEERVFVEAITNQYESREAVKFAGVFVCEVWCAHSTGATFCGLATAPVRAVAERHQGIAEALLCFALRKLCFCAHSACSRVATATC